MTDVSAVVTVRGEPPRRLYRLLDHLKRQKEIDPFELIVAAPPEERLSWAPLQPGGSVAHIQMVDNPAGGRSSGLNIAVDAAQGAVICRFDARALPPPDYVATCVRRLEVDPGVGVVGGRQRPVSVSDGIVALGIGRALRNHWALGGAAYRKPGAEGPVDTVYLGTFRRTELVDIGGYDETLEANEDFELCSRYRRAGYAVWLEAELVVDYEARDTLGAVWSQYASFGRAKARLWRQRKGRPNARQAAALVGGLATAVVAAKQLRDPRRLAAGALGAVAVAGAGDHLADRGERRVGVRAASVATYATVYGAWFSGLAGELVRPGTSPGCRR